jgi:hypothetical protein
MKYLIALALFLVPTAAHADYVVWQDPKTGARLTYPDTWRTVNNQQPDDVVTILGPSQDDRPLCRLRARHDARFTMYPPGAARDVQLVAIDRDFWIDYTGAYDNVTFHEIRDDAGLGRAYAGLASASFTEAGPKNPQARTGIFLAGIYHDKAYILDCSARRGAYTTWYPDFMGIAKSLDMQAVIQATPVGTYTPLMLEPNRYTRPVKAAETTAPLNN